MSFRLRRIETTAAGRRIERDRVIEDERLTIGRAAGCALHLPDLALDERHAELALEPDGTLTARALGTLGFVLDGATVTSAAIDPAAGAELRFAGYRVQVSRDPSDGLPLLTVTTTSTDNDDHGHAPDPKRAFTLASVTPPRRALGWGLVAAILSLFLALPIASQLYHRTNPHARIHGDKAWDVGPLSRAHHRLSDNCAACHVQAFVPVRDETCRGCHKTVHDHADTARLARARAAPSWGEGMLWGVAHLFGKTGPGACVDCHREHEGGGAMEPARQQFCADCHASLKSRLTDTRLGDAGDFGTLHPGFAPLVVVDAATRTTRRVALDVHPREDKGIWFSHQAHLDPRGGAAKMAITLGATRGYGAPLGCSSCHHPSEDGVRFRKIEMERDCEACHDLAIDRVGGIVRTLRHGNIDQAIAQLGSGGGGAVDRVATPLIGGRSRPGLFTQAGPYYASFTAPRGGIGSIAQALGRDGVCGECHRPAWHGGRPGVVPVIQPERYMGHGWFDHYPHRDEKCVSCHSAAPRSQSSADVLIPDLASCRECHRGEAASKPRIASSCAMCHAYHPSVLAPRPGGQPQRRSDRREE